MSWLPTLDRRGVLGWLGAATGPLIAAAAVALLWAMSIGPMALARVPDLRGLASPAAGALAAERGLRTRDIRVVHGGIAGTVVSQNPPAGALLRRGEAVTVAVTIGARQVVVPDLTGMPLEQARGVLRRRGLAVGAVVYSDHPGREPGRVVATSPEPGSRVDQGTRIRIDVPLPGRT